MNEVLRTSLLNTSPLSLINQALDWISKPCETTMNELTIIRKEVHELRAANEKEKQSVNDPLLG
jgi:hypothetical protein